MQRLPLGTAVTRGHKLVSVAVCCGQRDKLRIPEDSAGALEWTGDLRVAVFAGEERSEGWTVTHSVRTSAHFGLDSNVIVGQTGRHPWCLLPN
jgi:hypothetical protein